MYKFIRKHLKAHLYCTKILEKHHLKKNLIGSETTDPFEAGSFSFEASDPFQPLPWRAQQTK